MINPGKYDKKINLLVNTKDKDAYGEIIDNWTIHKTVWASKNPLLGNEYFTALTNQTKVEVKFNMRYQADITNEMRIQHGAEVYDILSAIDVKSEHVETLCYCKLVK